MRLREMQSRIGAMALDRAAPDGVAALVRDDRPIPAAQRLAIHRNNTLIGLRDALASAFPVTRQLVGDDFFARLAGDFVRAHPPRRPELLAYGEELAAFIADYEAAAPVPCLADVARLEFAWNAAGNAADREPLAARELARFAPGELEGLTLTVHPSLRLVASDWPVMAVWRAHQSESGPQEPIDMDAGPDRLLVHRPRRETLIRKVGAGCFAFAMALSAGRPLAAACASALQDDPGFDISGELAGLITAELFVEAHPS